MVACPTETNPAGTLAFGPPVVTAVGSFPAALAEAGALDAMIEGTSPSYPRPHSKIPAFFH